MPVTVDMDSVRNLRLVNEAGQVHYSLVMSKSRVVHLKPITIPSLELSAAVVSVKISAILKQELDLKDVVECFWTDSKIVLGYIANDSRCFHVFIANRLQQIHDHTVQSQWRHIDTKANPAEIASRGVSADDLMKEQKWFNAPDILWEPNLSLCVMKRRNFINICKISFNKRYLLYTYLCYYPIATFQKAGTCLDAQQRMAKQPIKGCVSYHNRTCGKSVREKSE